MIRKLIPFVFATTAMLATGCTETFTREPFGETTRPSFAAEIRNSHWRSPGMDEKMRMTLSIVFDSAKTSSDTTITVRSEGKEQVYEARLHKVKTGAKGSPETVVFFRPKSSGKPWRFAWLGFAVNARENDKGIHCLLFFFPDSVAFETLGVAAEKDFPTKGYDIFSEKNGMLLTASPDQILATLKDKDLRTFMHVTLPFVFLRDDPLASKAPPPPVR